MAKAAGRENFRIVADIAGGCSPSKLRFCMYQILHMAADCPVPAVENQRSVPDHAGHDFSYVLQDRGVDF